MKAEVMSPEFDTCHFLRFDICKKPDKDVACFQKEMAQCHKILIIIALISLNSRLNRTFGEKMEIIILHNNDMRSRFEEINIDGGKCQKKDGQNLCYGGFARIYTVLNKTRESAAKKQGPPVLYINTGDTFTGSIYFYLFKTKVVAEFMNLLVPDVACLGNHEFDEGLTGLRSFLDRVDFPVVTSNIKNSAKLLPSLLKSTVIRVNGYPIGIVGYITSKTDDLSKQVRFKDEIQAIIQESKKLDAKGIKTIFALGHSDFDKDKEIARKCELIDLVLSGHSHVLLWNYLNATGKTINKPYPTLVQQYNKVVPIFHSYPYTLYLGRLYIHLDTDSGRIKAWHGQQILLDHQIKQDPQVMKLIKKYRKDIKRYETKTISKSKIFLKGEIKSCSYKECNVANLITDAFVDCRVRRYKGEYWTDAPIAIINSGIIGSSLNPDLNHGNITFRHVIDILPHYNDIIMVTVSGNILLKILETPVSKEEEEKRADFLHFSGLRVVYNLDKPFGKRVHSVLIKCGECVIPTFEKLQLDKDYRILTTVILAMGGKGYYILRTYGRNKTLLGSTDTECLTKYLEKQEIVYTSEEGRIKFIQKRPQTRNKSIRTYIKDLYF